MKKIGIMGTGPVGKVLAGGFQKKGYEVMIGSRDPEKLGAWKSDSGLNVKTGTFSDAAKFGEILVLAVKGSAAEEVLKLAGKDNLAHKTVIDTCNPIADLPPEDGIIRFFTDLNESLMERLQKRFPDVHFVKAFSSVGNGNMVDPDFGHEKPTMFIAGDDGKAKMEVAGVLKAFGWESEDMGTAKAARAIEPLCILYCIPGIRENSWNHAFRLLKS